MDKKYVKDMLNNLIVLDGQTTGAYYEMGRILHSFREGKLHEVLKFDNFSQLVEEQLSYSPATAIRYSNLYMQFKRLHYTKSEALNLLIKYGMTHMLDVMPSMENKIGDRAIKVRIDNLDQNQINFTLTGAELSECNRALARMGASRSDTGRWMNSSQALMDMVRQVNKSPTVMKAVA